jgi:hypothetical protein
MYQDEEERELEASGFRISDGDDDEPLDDDLPDFDNEDDEFDKDH